MKRGGECAYRRGEWARDEMGGKRRSTETHFSFFMRFVISA